MKGSSQYSNATAVAARRSPEGEGSFLVSAVFHTKSWWHLKHVLEWSDNLHLALE